MHPVFSGVGIGVSHLLGKGTLVDTLLCDPDRDARLAALWSEVHRVLRPGGKYISLNLHPEDRVLQWMEEFMRQLWGNGIPSWNLERFQVRASAIPAEFAELMDVPRHAMFCATKLGGGAHKESAPSREQ